jgi:hypothetical protein
MGQQDAITELLANDRRDKELERKQRFTFNWLANKIIIRQQHQKDTIIIIIGDRRAGKSNWGLKLIRAYIRLKKLADKNYSWNWKDNFPLTRTQSKKTASTLYRSFIFHDEGGDQFYNQETLKRAQRELVKFMNKSGSRLHLTIVIWPDPFTLDPRVINMAHILVIVPYRYREVCSFAFLYGRNPNPLTYDKFGIIKIRKKLDSPTKSNINVQLPAMNDKLRVVHGSTEMEIPYPRNLFRFLKSMPTFMKSHRFGKVDKRFEDAYKKNVKEKELVDEEDDNVVPKFIYEKLKDQYATLLFNLVKRADMSYAQIERLHIAPSDGMHLKAIPGIKKLIESVEAKI